MPFHWLSPDEKQSSNIVSGRRREITGAIRPHQHNGVLRVSNRTSTCFLKDESTTRNLWMQVVLLIRRDIAQPVFQIA